MSLEGITSVSEACKNIIEIIANIAERYNSKRGEILEEHVEPLYEKMQLIHNDYLKGFLEAKRCIQNDEDPSRDLSKFLEGRRLTQLAQREAADSFANSISDLEKTLLSKEEQVLIREFAQACIDYLKRSSRIGRISWYSEVIRLNAMYVDFREQGLEGKAWEHPENGDNVKARLLAHLSFLLDGELSMAFKPVNDSYFNIRKVLR
ncbi:hypothetical protein RKK48_003550 [Vibrio cholerae]|uniref:hypothetical protein n=1 Tax=Vibrio cholerae TaxID=666 RepID=UPI00215F9086|nr:hypothetical protein [Vibrio cholerae]EJF1759405.1 hypothetical protein [Vibrio cholerae]EKF9231014.1 hypothetical protein [Vibrio cholerae]ELD3372274.1 hypothetical protein [Vibrio cholerae]MCS0097687.1 hypothetical protein [Vibrio cholerae]